MQQQLIVSVIDIVPATMEEVLGKLQPLLASSTLEQDGLLPNIVKSLFFGLWNFDKMINQHNLNTRIAELLLRLPRKSALLFLRAFLSLLQEKWNLIDKHRINKFMQLVRYMLASAVKLGDKYKNAKRKVERILLETVLAAEAPQSGLAFHIIDIFFEVCEEVLPVGATLEDLAFFEGLLGSHQNEHMRLYIMEHIYEKYKLKLLTCNTDMEVLETHLLEFSNRFLELAKKEEKDLYRKNLYALVGYVKSEEVSFDKYIREKREKAKLELQKHKKKISKGKKKEIRKMKEARKEKKEKQGKKAHKIKSLFKFEDKNNQRKAIEL